MRLHLPWAGTSSLLRVGRLAQRGDYPRLDRDLAGLLGGLGLSQDTSAEWLPMSVITITMASGHGSCPGGVPHIVSPDGDAAR